MADRADAHIHLFETGFQGGSFTARPGVNIDELACYESLAKSFGVKAALVVGWAGAPWASGNNAYLARVVGDHPWVNPVAYLEPSADITVASLTERRGQGFVGLSFYISGTGKVAGLHRIRSDVWTWLADRRWLISVNSRGEHWDGWLPVLEKHPSLRVVMSHMGLPGAAKTVIKAATARKRLSHVIALAKFPGVHVKLSGFYAASDPSYDYPHQTAWPYVEALLEAFGPKRLVWGSDFSPSLDHLAFPQTFGHFVKMPFLTKATRERIEGGNLLALLGQVDRKA